MIKRMILLAQLWWYNRKAEKLMIENAALRRQLFDLEYEKQQLTTATALKQRIEKERG